MLQLVVSARSINIEAQHALLKVIEEPPATTQFTFILPSICWSVTDDYVTGELAT
jgi:hypothetical protein